MESVDTVVVGAGHAGLATSHALTRAGVEHVVLERGRIGERWLSERWDSLRLLTPNWMSRLPGWRYVGPDPDGFMSARELAATLEDYARSFAAPVVQATVVAVDLDPAGGFVVVTDRGTWRSERVVVATGYNHHAAAPRSAAGLPSYVAQVDPLRYKGPRSVEPGGVLVVGASSTGVQIARELRASGRDVVLAAGRHTRLPRRHRGRDIMGWLDDLGTFDRTIDEGDAQALRSEPSLQLAGGADDLDLAVLQPLGVQVTGRFLGAYGSAVLFADDLAANVAEADRRMRRVLDRIDAVAGMRGAAESDVPPVDVSSAPPCLDLLARDVRTVIWATGFRGSWPWLHLPVVVDGHIAQYRGRTAVPGLYTVGQRFQHRRGSGLVDGVRHDVTDVVGHIVDARTNRVVAPAETSRTP